MIDSPKRPKIVGTFIRQRREALHLSQRALGLLFDPPVTTQFISNVERGVTPLPPAHVPTLTKALQVSEAELMGLLEKEYTQKLSGRLGLAHDSPALVSDQTMSSPSDFEFIQRLYQAYQLADVQTRQAFAGVCQNMLNFRLTSPAVSVRDASQSSQSQTQPAAALASAGRG